MILVSSKGRVVCMVISASLVLTYDAIQIFNKIRHGFIKDFSLRYFDINIVH